LRILLDNCVPADLAPHIRGHDVASAVELGWAAFEDSQLLDAMAGRFEILLTVDTSIRFQQRLDGRPFSVVVLRARSNRVGQLARLLPALLKALQDIKPGELREIEAG
jgi:predicted nuclease of predicted toxin-antitoxin system